MTTSQPTHFLYEIESGNLPIPPGKLAYFQERLRNNIYDFVLTKFLEKEREGLTKALLARRLGSDPAVVSRLLGAPGNWTLDTVSNLLLGIAAEELKPASVTVLNKAERDFATPDRRKHQHPDWVHAVGQQPEPQQSLQTPAPFDPTIGGLAGPRQLMPVSKRLASFDSMTGGLAGGTASIALPVSSVDPFAQSNNPSTKGQSLPPELLGERRAA